MIIPQISARIYTMDKDQIIQKNITEYWAARLCTFDSLTKAHQLCDSLLTIATTPKLGRDRLHSDAADSILRRMSAMSTTVSIELQIPYRISTVVGCRPERMWHVDPKGTNLQQPHLTAGLAFARLVADFL